MHRLRHCVWLAILAGCHFHGHDHVDGGVLGRVVVYRNGVAFYERNATVEDGQLTVHVPRDKVDDFLKSLTVVDRITKKPLAVTIPRKEAVDGSYLTMTVETPDSKHAEVLLTYVTDAPAWKPSYRVVVGDNNKVMLEGWAIVDNTTSEDWKGVLVGVGASSALAFRYDLWSVHTIDRDLLQGEERFAIAPPTGVSPYSDTGTAEELASLDSSEVRGGVAAGDTYGKSFSGATSNEDTYVVEGINTTSTTFGRDGSTQTTGVISGTAIDQSNGDKAVGATVVATSPSLQGEQVQISDEKGRYRITNLPPGIYTLTFYYNNNTSSRSNVLVKVGREVAVMARLSSSTGRGNAEVIEITGSAPIIDVGSTTTSIPIDTSDRFGHPGGAPTTMMNDYTKNIPTSRTFGNVLGAAAGSQGDSQGASDIRQSDPQAAAGIKQGDDKLKAAVAKVLAAKKDVVIEAHGGTEADAKMRAETVRNKLVDDGVPAAKIHVVAKSDGGTSVRVLAVHAGAKPETAAPPSAKTHGPVPDAPVGESHFMADRPMTVRAGTSAMVAMVHGETTGGVVYLYDPISDRGDKRFAFKAVRLDNPTNDTLEPGPVTVYGDGRFIGEGITEPVPPKASVVVPFALDRQVVVEREGSDEDRIAKLVTVQRGMLTAEVQHRRETRFTITSRLHEPTRVFLRHQLAPGWELVTAPKLSMKVGDSKLYEVVLEPGATEHVLIVESTPVERSIDLSSDDAMKMMKVFITEPEASPALKAQVSALLATHQGGEDLVDKIQTLREQINEFRGRSGELHAQIVTLKAVKTGGDLMATLKAKLADTSDRIQKATIAIVDTQEQLMLQRVKFQNQLAELHLTDVTKAARK